MKTLDENIEEIKIIYLRASMPFIILLPDGKINYCNIAADDFLQLTYGIYIEDMASEKYRHCPVSEDWLEKLETCVRTKRFQKWTASYPVHNEKGSLTYRKCTLTPFFNEKKGVYRILGEAFDITEMVKIQKKLEAKNEQINAVAFTARHDLRGGLDGLVFAVDFINEALSKAQMEALGIDSAVEMISMELEKQAAILEGMKDWLDMAKRDTEKKEAVNLGEVVEMLKNNSLYNGEVIIKNLPALKVSKGQFALLFDHLIKNGLYYNDKPERRVKIYADEEAIIIEDNGNGFPIEKFETMCKPFQRLDKQKTGSGLGLAIVKSICDNHGFIFTAKSEIGTGSKFLIHFI